jgi:hypothetical protein
MKVVVRKTWRELSEAAAHEQDPEKLLQLVEELNRVLEEQEKQVKKQYAAPAPRLAHFVSPSFAPVSR